MLKDFQVDLELSPKDNRVIQTGATYWSHDVNTAKINIKLLRHSEPVILNKDVTVRVMMLFDDENKSEHIYTAKIEDEKAGIVSVILDKNVRSYVGQVICGVYADYGAEQKTDNGYFTFAMKRSLIDKRMPEMKQYYVSDFEDTLAKMKLTNAEFATVETKLNGRIDVIENKIKANDIVTKPEFDDMTVGNRNLLKRGAWYSSSGGVLDIKDNFGENLSIFHNEGSAWPRLYNSSVRDIEWIDGETYTLSFYIRANGNNYKGISMQIADDDSTNKIMSTGELVISTIFKRFDFTFKYKTIDTSKITLQVFVYNQSNMPEKRSIFLKQAMLTRGTRAGLWVPAIEDLSSKLEAINLQRQIGDFKNLSLEINNIKKAITTLGGTL